MQRTAVVIGASGLVGSHLIKQLIAAQDIDKIVSLSRRPIEHSHSKVSNHVIDFENLGAAIEYFQGDYLFSCLGTTKKSAGSIAAQRRVDFDHQYNAAKIAAAQGVDHYLLVSAIGANADSYSAYSKMKGELEQQVQVLPFKRISIIQPSLLLGKRKEHRWGEAAATAVLPTLCRLPMLRKYQPITAEQVAIQLVSACHSLHQGLVYI